MITTIRELLIETLLGCCIIIGVLFLLYGIIYNSPETKARNFILKYVQKIIPYYLLGGFTIMTLISLVIFIDVVVTPFLNK